MNAPDPLKSIGFALPDVQGSPDARLLAIQRVGIKGVRYPFVARTAAGEAQPTIGLC